MAGRIRKDDIEALKQRADIASVIADHTDLKKAGTRLKGLCPFHTEKTPSFTVDPVKGYYHCFGCGEGGDVYSFLMGVGGLDFTEAVEQLARRTGFELHYEDLSPGQRRALGERSRFVEINQRALDFFHERLLSDEGEVARTYLRDRGFGREEAEAFSLGYAPNDWERLSRALVSEGYDRRDLVRIGLAVDNKRGGLRDRFRGRLIFPVLDASGDPIGFGGRVLPGLDYGDFDPPKYYNSPETPLYRKQKVLYGIAESRAGMASTGEVLVCEGYTDVLALHQSGITNAVATCGTAVGAEHFRVLARYVNRVVLAFDADEAGVKAAERAATEAAAVDDEARTGSSSERFQVRVLGLEEGSDPADLVQRDGPVALREALTAAEPVTGFLVDAELDRADLSSDEGRATALRAAVRRLGDEPDPELRRVWARTRIADRLGVSTQWVARTAQRVGVTLDREDGVAAGVGLARRGGGQRGRLTATPPPEAALQRRVLRVALQEPDWLPEEWWELTGDDFTHPRARSIHDALTAAGGAGVPLEEVLAAAPDDDVRALVRAVALEVADPPDTPESAAGEVRALRERALVARVAELDERVRTVNASTDPEAFRALNAERFELEQQRRALRTARD
ncbi:DNA primase [Salsipaludibacter albus]|uniref:DNA primase n=1 Tax=Salsipaludibacter albus TaxID=2849650 RepID=UPI001EE3BBBF|nr:DNA primase [Salsipaludibacter albus]MBY5164411.1 DNA primase [Salsipaludibacter albus]